MFTKRHYISIASAIRTAKYNTEKDNLSGIEALEELEYLLSNIFKADNNLFSSSRFLDATKI